MSRLAILEQNVSYLYEAKHLGRADWADWLYERHVFVVAEKTAQLSERFNADAEPAVAAAMLHDIADAVMSRFDERHTEESLRIDRELLDVSGFSTDEIRLIIDDIIAKHSCRDGTVSESLAGKVMATADALAHITTDFYFYAVWANARGNKAMTTPNSGCWLN